MTQKPQTYYERFKTPKELSRPTITEIRDICKTLSAMSSNLNDCLKKDNASLLAKRCSDYATDLSTVIETLTAVASELE